LSQPREASAAISNDRSGSWRSSCTAVALGTNGAWVTLRTSRAESSLPHHLGADGVGLNPLHRFFDAPGRSAIVIPYSPNSRLFLTRLYDIGVDKLLTSAPTRL